MSSSNKESSICRPEHAYYCMAVLSAKLLHHADPDVSEFLTEDEQEQEYPLFITWNKYPGDDYSKTPELRGCIGNFSAMPLGEGLREYALTAALKDTRFNPIKPSELPSLQCGVSLLTPFEPARDPLDWTLGTHGIHITFTISARRYTGTYLPDVAPAQGWTKVQTVQSLCRKAGWRGEVRVDGEVWERMVVRRYRSEKCVQDWGEFVQWRDERDGEGELEVDEVDGNEVEVEVKS